LADADAVALLTEPGPDVFQFSGHAAPRSLIGGLVFRSVALSVTGYYPGIVDVALSLA
jgi:hypothetical protein